MNLNAIDVSSNNNPINYKAYKGQVIISKVTGGTSYYWAGNVISESLKHGFLTGAYHFAHENNAIKPSKDQAKYFYDHIKPYLGKVLPILDYEVPLNGTTLTQHDMNWVDDFMIYFKKLSGINCVLYCSKDFIWNTKIPEFTKNNCMLWFAQYASNEPTGFQSNPWTDSRKLDMNICGQQYSSHGRINGINGNVDLSLFYMDKAGFLRSCKPTK